MLLAAGRGERMRPLTDHTPKPLLAVRGQPLLHWALSKLAAGGVTGAVLNTAWLGERIEQHFGPVFEDAQGSQVALRYSREQVPGEAFSALETAGGISRALPWLDEVFWVAAGDVYAPDFHFGADDLAAFAASDHLAHIWLVPNPPEKPRGDFGLTPQGLATSWPHEGDAGYTYSTIGLYRRALFEAPWCEIEPGNPAGEKAPLAPLLRTAMDAGRVSAQLYTGRWTDVGTPERLAKLNAD
ncbi:MAG: N-acetylmuramate alpha-1-phosphate uridylyltransferase [Paracidovorax wautersii]|uniref:N-acetylmuramate alpha-1-phosphate uridylyltransferase n=1 Tax=Paracidovorax wautersii TaxID=1177982 RepID=A0A7V8FP91_9BURK|nr:MAG: N-acetylmuramate alpha-1-phosphate uridylyltransferase [Paracidovorax wautersii]